MKAISSGGVIIYRGKVLLLYKFIQNRYDAWVLPKGTVEPGETLEQTALREVGEEAGVQARIMSYLGSTKYSFRGQNNIINKEVHWYLMGTSGYYSRPQKEEFFVDSGFFKENAAKFLLKYENELAMMERGFKEYQRLKKLGRWPKEL